MSRGIEMLNEFAAAWWDWTVASTWQGSLLLLVAIMLLALGKSLRPGLRYGLLLVVLLKFAVPPAFDVAYGFSDMMARAFSVETTPARNTEVRIDVAPSPGPVRAATPPPVQAAHVAPSVPALSPAAWLLVAELAGALAILFLIQRQWSAARRLLRRGIAGDDALRARFQSAARALDLRRTPRLRLSEEAGAPQSGGILRPFVLLPSWAAAMPVGDLEILLAHELAHVRRMDALVNGFQAAAQALLWWNPLVWWLNRRIREERELCCDDLVLSRGIASGADYSRALVNVAERVSLPASSWAMAGMADNFGGIERRVRRALEGGRSTGNRGRWAGTVLLVLVAGWVLPGATDVEVQSGAGAVVGRGDVDARIERGIRPTWPMVKYPLEEFLDWRSGWPLQPREDLDAPGNVMIAVRGIQIDRDADLLLPDGRTLAEWLAEDSGAGVGTATEADWVSLGVRLQELRELGQADFTHLSHGAVGRRGEMGVTIPTALDRGSGGSASVEYVALNLGMLPNIIPQDGGSPAIELNLHIDQTVVADTTGTKNKYGQSVISRNVRIESAEAARWIVFVSDTKAERVNIVCLRLAIPNDVGERSESSKEPFSDAPSEAAAATTAISQFKSMEVAAHAVFRGENDLDVTVFEDVELTLNSTENATAVPLRANRLEHTNRADGSFRFVMDGDVLASFQEFTIEADRLQLENTFLFSDAKLDSNDFGAFKAEQIRVDPVARRIDILNGTVDEARLKAAFGEGATNAPKGEWLTLPFAVVRQIMVKARIVEFDRDADFRIPGGMSLQEIFSDGVTPIGYLDASQWMACEASIMELASQDRAKLLASPSLITNEGQEASISIGVEVAEGEVPSEVEKELGISIRATPTIGPAGDDPEALSLVLEVEHKTLGQPVGGKPSIDATHLTSKLLVPKGEEEQWIYQLIAGGGDRAEVLFVNASVVRPGAFRAGTSK